ncbi:hypothetical protein Rumeso_04334 [Rubellimicrobium mesophilum DSM 19309]|uniref:SGNH/GDSL hydrolase family protein n=1 Tax=Rubellimicrobium mesophilum DSM 19309 TaxID=442562 RepID=A0A017HIJ0_9RHOB|nr:hypothetical protein [Rubellimicrobium mesophilum]EYD74135.1 hypothetical protein Rumeso_04334 [Rubellimicrobium mesophilum DSM 19309]
MIGNSHVGALKLAWDALRTSPQACELTFFAQRQARILDLLSKGNRLVPSSKQQRAQLKLTSGGLGEIDTAAYDIFLVYGLYPSPSLTEDGRRYSQAVREAAVLDRALGSGTYEMVQRLRAITPKLILVGLSPLRANVPDTSSRTVQHLRAITRKPMLMGLSRLRTNSAGSALPPPLMPYRDTIDILDRRVFAPLDARLIPQPAETIVDGRATDAKYTIGSRRLSAGSKGAFYPDQDNGHMNEAYGRVWLLNLQRHLVEQGSRATLRA